MVAVRMKPEGVGGTWMAKLHRGSHHGPSILAAGIGSLALNTSVWGRRRMMLRECPPSRRAEGE